MFFLLTGYFFHTPKDASRGLAFCKTMGTGGQLPVISSTGHAWGVLAVPWDTIVTFIHGYKAFLVTQCG